MGYCCACTLNIYRLRSTKKCFLSPHTTTGLPAVVKNCSFNNQTLHSFEVQCAAGYDGGLPQVFVLELVSSRTGVVRYNMTNTEEPFFVIESLDALVAQHQTTAGSGSGATLLVNQDGQDDDRKSAAAAISRTTTATTSTATTSTASQPERSFKAVIFSVNQKGRSPRVILKEFLIGDGSRTDRSSDSGSFQVSPILIGAVVTLLIIFALMVVRMFLRRQAKSNDSLDNSKQSSSLLCTAGELNKVGVI